MFEEMTIKQYNAILADKSPTPGGGSALAVVGTIACSLVEMSINVTLTKLQPSDPNYEYLQSERGFFARAKAKLAQLSDDDATAFRNIIDCNHLPRDTAEQIQHRTMQQQKAYHKAALVPLDVIRICKEAMFKAKQRVFPLLYKYVAGDCKIGIELFVTVAENSMENVYANTALITDKSLRDMLDMQGKSLVEQMKQEQSH